MEVRSDPFESAKSNLFDTSSWGDFCDVTLTLKQGNQPHSGGWVKTDDYRCRHAFRHFMNLLNRASYGSAFRRHGKRLRVLAVLEKGEVRARGLRSWERCAPTGRWHIHCAGHLEQCGFVRRDFRLARIGGYFATIWFRLIRPTPHSARSVSALMQRPSVRASRGGGCCRPSSAIRSWLAL